MTLSRISASALPKATQQPARTTASLASGPTQQSLRFASEGPTTKKSDKPEKPTPPSGVWAWIIGLKNRIVQAFRILLGFDPLPSSPAKPPKTAKKASKPVDKTDSNPASPPVISKEKPPVVSEPPAVIQNPEFLPKARTMLAAFYTKQGKAKEAADVLAGVGCWGARSVYRHLFREVYESFRYGDYKGEHRHNPDIHTITQASKPGLIKATDKNDWHFREPENQAGWKPAQDRMSLNVFGSKDLIDALDNVFGSGKIKGYYKTPNHGDWSYRNDPITIYLHEPISPEIIKTIVGIASPYVRSDKPVLTGTPVAPGISAEKIPSLLEMKAYLALAYSLDKTLGDAVREEFTDRVDDKGNRIFKNSSGGMIAVQQVLTELSKDASSK